MSVIKNDDNIFAKKGKSKKDIYVLPAVIRENKDSISFEQSLVVALLLHPIIVLLILIGSLVLNLLGFSFDKPIEKPKDIEFVLVEKEAPPIDKNTKNRADKNSQAGGKHDPNRPVSLPKESAPKSPEKKPTPPAPKKQEVKKQTPKPQPQKQTQPKVEKPVPQTPAQPQTPTPPKAPAPRPTPAPSVAKPTTKPQSDFNIPIPKSAIPQITQPVTTAPVTAEPKVASGGTGGASGNSSPTPSFSPTSSSNGSYGGKGTSAGGGGRFSNGTGSGSGNVGNPSPGNPNGAPGIDAIKEPDFGPYMKELQRRIKMNWDPPKGNESKRVVLLFSIARDGRLLNVSVHRSSGLQAADNAAINAVKLTAPFRPLPPEFKGSKVDIQFTFDYNVWGVSY